MIEFVWMVITDFSKGFLIGYVVCIAYSEHTLQNKIAARVILYQWNYCCQFIVILQFSINKYMLGEKIMFRIDFLQAFLTWKAVAFFVRMREWGIWVIS